MVGGRTEAGRAALHCHRAVGARHEAHPHERSVETLRIGVAGRESRVVQILVMGQQRMHRTIQPQNGQLRFII